MKELINLVDKKLDEYLQITYPEDIFKAMKYTLMLPGKRLRPIMCLETVRMLNGDIEKALPTACAIEMLHVQSLIHDDLPCMDNDDMRRGKPSCHKAFGETIALLAGDALLTYAFETAADGKNNAINAVSVLAKSAGALGMCRGQELDLLCECHNYNELENLHNLKTGALINAAATLGYLASGAEITEDNMNKIKNYALSVGLAFQIIDDLLDVRSTAEELGKPIGSDTKNGKKTVLSYMSEEQADKIAMELSIAASKVFESMENSDVVCKLPLYLLSRTK